MQAIDSILDWTKENGVNVPVAAMRGKSCHDMKQSNNNTT